MVKVAVRVNGGPNIGMGHIQRCLALSSQLRKKGAEILFVSKEEEAVERKIKQEGFEVITLRDNIDLKEDLQDTINAIKAYRADVVITDSYAIDEHYLAEIKKTVLFLVSIDDLAEIFFPSDIVINQNVYAKRLNYYSLTGQTKFLLGPKYALLREEFSNPPKRKVNEKVENVLITLGGADPFNLTSKILKVLDRINQNFKITVVIGVFFKNIAEIEKAARDMDKEIELIYDSAKMNEEMLDSDLAITGGGTTLYELAATGTPALAFCLTGDQVRNIREMSRRGMISDLGWRNRFDEENLHRQIIRLADDYDQRRQMSQRGQEAVDGKGASRCVDVMLSSCLGVIPQF